jgi:hypothetical protein
MEAVIQLAQDQKILPREVNPEEMFASNTLDLKSRERAAQGPGHLGLIWGLKSGDHPPGVF